jgi:glycosyltransferase involved in cell wall biosynthesis
MKYLLITDIPAPWREKVFEKVYQKFGDDFHVVYIANNEKRRLWKFSLGSHAKTFLKNTLVTAGEKERWINFEIIPFLFKNKPEIVICFSLQPTIFLAFILCRLLKIRLAILSDTWLERDKDISRLQKFGRKVAYNYFGDAFIGASKQTIDMFKYYNKKAPLNSYFLSWLCADNEYFEDRIKLQNVERIYDVMFSGRIVDLKNPLFFADVAKRIRDKRGKCKALIIGEGDQRLKSVMLRVLKEGGVEYDFAGFIEHNKLPDYYAKAKVFLFPTSGDCWGVVLNEALVSGLPVITTDKTAAAGELIIDGENGYILPMEPSLWADRTCILLNNNNLLAKLSKSAIESVNNFTFDKASKGLIEAINFLKRT